MPVEKQIEWLKQRGWEPHPETPNVFIDPNTRVSFYLTVALKRALDDCRVDSDTQLKVKAPARKDDAPFPLPKKQ
jgi:hypothetical protein